MKIVILYNDSERRECGESGSERADESLEEEIKIVEQSLRELDYEYRSVVISRTTPVLHILNLVNGLRPDCIFNLVEAVNGNYQAEMNIPAALDLLGIPYTGSGALALGICQDKAKSKAIMRSAGIRTPFFEVFESVSPVTSMTGFFPLIVKPVHEDGSLGISESSVVTDNATLQDEIYKVLVGYQQPAIAEQYIDGREFGVGVINFNGGPIPFPVSEIIFDGYPKWVPRIVTYNSKWDGGSIEYKESKPHCPAEISEAFSKKIQEVGLKVFRLFGCRGYGRIDIRARGENIYVIECNPNADIAPGSGIETILKAAGVSYPEFVKNIIDGALHGK